MRLALIITHILMIGCDTGPPLATANSSAALERGEMIIYRAGHAVPESELIDLGPPADLGGTVLEGDPAISARFDYLSGGFAAGVFQATRGTVLIHFPFTEHATILAGKVKLTDETGTTRVLKPGDSYFITQGSTILWEVRGRRVQKSFFNRVGPVDNPGPMIVYERNRGVDQPELVDLGPPSDLGGTVLEGDPAISARVDHTADGAVAGVFQATCGTVLIDFPFTEHATITKGKVELTDETGLSHLFKPGDSYLVKQNSMIVWEVSRRRVQKTFYNFVEP